MIEPQSDDFTIGEIVELLTKDQKPILKEVLLDRFLVFWILGHKPVFFHPDTASPLRAEVVFRHKKDPDIGLTEDLYVFLQRYRTIDRMISFGYFPSPPSGWEARFPLSEFLPDPEQRYWNDQLSRADTENKFSLLCERIADFIEDGKLRPGQFDSHRDFTSSLIVNRTTAARFAAELELLLPDELFPHPIEGETPKPDKTICPKYLIYLSKTGRYTPKEGSITDAGRLISEVFGVNFDESTIRRHIASTHDNMAPEQKRRKLRERRKALKK